MYIKLVIREGCVDQIWFRLSLPGLQRLPEMTMRWKGWTVAMVDGRMSLNLNPSATRGGVRAPIIGSYGKYVVYSHEVNNKFEENYNNMYLFT